MPIETMLSALWNGRIAAKSAARTTAPPPVGAVVEDGIATSTQISIPHAKRTEHVAILGRTGAGKSSLLKQFCVADMRAGRGFLFFDLHGDAVPDLVHHITTLERERDEDLSARTVVIDPSDEEYAVGLDLFDGNSALRRFVAVAETVEILKRRWDLDALGGRTEELLRNALLLTQEAGLTLVDLPLILTDVAARRSALATCKTPGVIEYFRDRYDGRSEALQATYREAVLNKVTVFTADPHFRHVLGQVPSTFSLCDAVEHGAWVFVSLPRGALGVEAQTFGSLVLARLKDALFARQSRTLFTIYADEFQQLATYDAGIEELFSESRKFGVSVVAANQFLEQHSALLQHALLALGTQIYFQLSGPDANRIAHMVGGGPTLAETLANLPKRELMLALGSTELRSARVRESRQPTGDVDDLLGRIRQRWARRRTEVETSIAHRAASLRAFRKDDLDGWQ